MTKTYRIQARCLRPFHSLIDMNADTPEKALAKARLEDAEFTAAAEDSEIWSWPWDEFTVFDHAGTAVLHTPDAEDCQREATPDAVASQRLALQELVRAAEELLAAIQDATDQFEGECTALDAACTTARAVLGSADGQNVHELLARRREIALIWSVDDVLDLRPDLTAEQAWEVLLEVERHHEAEYGVNWDRLACTADTLFGPAPETDAA